MIKKISVTIFYVAAIVIIMQLQTLSSDTSKKTENYLKTGDTVPLMKMEDIDGKERCNKDYLDRIIVYSFGDRESNKPLQKVIIPAGKKILRNHPDLRVVYVNVADLQIVPNLFKHVVTPILNYINDSNKKDLKDGYAKEGLKLDEDKTTFMLIPDWDADCLKVFRIKDAKDWVCFVTYKSIIRGVFDASTKNFEQDFLNLFNELNAQVKSGK